MGGSFKWIDLIRAGITLGYFAARGIVADLHRVRELTEIKHDDNEERMISQGTEDGM